MYGGWKQFFLDTTTAACLKLFYESGFSFQYMTPSNWQIPEQNMIWPELSSANVKQEEFEIQSDAGILFSL